VLIILTLPSIARHTTDSSRLGGCTGYCTDFAGYPAARRLSQLTTCKCITKYENKGQMKISLFYIYLITWYFSTSKQEPLFNKYFYGKCYYLKYLRMACSRRALNACSSALARL
jgi:hypothetical protein